jgi:hypothetical protein
MPGVAFPPVGRLGLTSPPSSVLCSAKTATLSVSGRFACRSLPDTLPAPSRSWCPARARGLVEAPRPRQGFWSPGPPFRECIQGDRWLSQVPELPLCLHAPLLDPGGVPGSCRCEPGTVGFRPVETVGVPLLTVLRVILMSTTIHISHNQFHESSLNPKVSGFPWRDHCMVSQRPTLILAPSLCE